MAEELRSILDQWQLLPEKAFAVTTDNHANMVCTLQLNDWMNVPCSSHMAVESVAVSRIIKSSPSLWFVSHFHHSSKSMQLLVKDKTRRCTSSCP